jgi:hypothetical protein
MSCAKPVMQRSGDCGAVGSEPVGSDLEGSPRSRVADAFYKDIRGRLVALAHRNIQNQFAVSFDGNENIAVAKVLIVLGADAFLFLAGVRSYLIKLQIAYRNIEGFFGHDAFALFPSDAE